MVTSLPEVWETQVRSLGQEDPLKKEMATHSSTLAWRIPWMEEPGRLQSMRLQRVGHDWATSLSLSVIQVQYPVFLHILSSTGAQHRDGWNLMAARWWVFFSFLSFLRVHQLTLDGYNHRWLWHPWWLWHPCLLIWQEILHFSYTYVYIFLIFILFKEAEYIHWNKCLTGRTPFN